MASASDKVIKYIGDNPWILAAGGVIGLLLLAGSNKGNASGGGISPDMMLKSQEITSQSNIALSQIAADSNAKTAESNAMYMGFLRDIALGAQSVAMNDTQANIAAQIAGMQTNSNLIEANNQVSLQTTLAALGYKSTQESIAANKEIQDFQIASSQASLFESLATDRYLADKNYQGLVKQTDSNTQISMADIAAMLESSAMAAALSRDLYAQEFGFMDRSQDRYYANQDMMTNNQLRVIHQVGKEERKTMGQAGMFDIFKAGVNALGNVAAASAGGR